MTHAACCIALQRHERKGLVQCRDDENASTGGRTGRCFEVTEIGLGKLRSSAEAIFAMWSGVDPP